MFLKLLEGIVGFLAVSATIAQMLTGLLVCRAIKGKHSTRDISSTPFVVGLVISLLKLQQAHMLGNSFLSMVNVLGIMLNSGYIAFYYAWSKEKQKNELTKRLTFAMVTVALLSVYASIEREEEVQRSFGFILAGIIVASVVEPFRMIPQVIENESTDGLPYPQIFAAFIVSLFWFLYSLIVWDKWLLLENALATTLSGVLLSFFSIYPDAPVNPAAKSSIKSE